MVCARAGVIIKEEFPAQKMIAKQRKNAVLAQPVSTDQRDNLAIHIRDRRHKIQDLMGVLFPHDVAIEAHGIHHRPRCGEGILIVMNAIDIADDLLPALKAILRIPLQQSEDEFLQFRGDVFVQFGREIRNKVLVPTCDQCIDLIYAEGEGACAQAV